MTTTQNQPEPGVEPTAGSPVEPPVEPPEKSRVKATEEPTADRRVGEVSVDASSAAPDGDIDQLADTLDTLFTVQRDFFAGLAERLGLLEVDLRAVMYVWRRDQVSPKALARHLRLTGGGATTVVDRMAARQLLARIPNSHDRRSLFIVTTPKGDRVGNSVRRTFCAELSIVATNPSHRHAFGVMVQRLNRRIGSSTDTADDLDGGA